MNQHPDWTEAEDATLRRLTMEGKTAIQIAGIMGRTYNSIKGRRKRVGLSDELTHRSPVGAPIGLDSQRDWRRDAERGSARLAQAIIQMLEKREQRGTVAA